MSEWKGMDEEEREQYVNQDYVPRKHILVNPDTFDSRRHNIASLYYDLHIPEVDIENILLCLTTKQEEVIRLRYIEGKNLPDIAERLGIRKQSVFDRITAAKGRLLKYAKENKLK